MTSITKEDVERLVGNHDYLLSFWDELEAEEKIAFHKQLSELDFNSLDADFKNTLNIPATGCENLEPVSQEHQESAETLEKSTFDSYWKTGLEQISQNKVAALVLAGGQASRLGTIHAKGTVKLDINVAHGDSLLGIQAAKIKILQDAADKLFGTKSRIEWIIMTSSGTHEETKEHVKELASLHGLDQDQITIFQQRNIPAFAKDGKYLLATKSSLVLAPNGNGGLYESLKPLLPELEAKGLEYVHVYCVDNILCKVADPAFIGFAKTKNADVVTKIVPKLPGELVGSVCLDAGRPRVVEYSELGAELANKKTNDGRYLFGAGSIANHLFSMEFLKRVCDGPALPYHVAHKKIAHYDQTGKLVQPQEPNGIKLEKFVFDVFEHSKNFHMWEVDRHEEFSPLKNADHVGKDCITTCRRDLMNLNRKWLSLAGAKISDVPVFVKSSVSYNGEGLDELNNQHIDTTTVEKFTHILVPYSPN